MQLMNVLRDSIPFLLKGTLVTIWISLATLILATILGMLINILCMLTRPLVRTIISYIVDLVRGTPLVVVIFLTYYGLPLININIPSYPAAVLALSIFFTAGMYETIRGGIASVPKGQTDALLALGMTRMQGLKRIIIPQAMRTTIPPWVGEFTGIIKGSSLIALLSLFELTLAGREIVERTYMGIGIWGVVMIIYFLICFPLSKFSQKMEQKYQYIRQN